MPLKFKKRFIICLSEDDDALLDDVAERCQRTRSQVVAQAVRAYSETVSGPTASDVAEAKPRRAVKAAVAALADGWDR